MALSSHRSIIRQHSNKIHRWQTSRNKATLRIKCNRINTWWVVWANPSSFKAPNNPRSPNHLLWGILWCNIFMRCSTQIFSKSQRTQLIQSMLKGSDVMLQKEKSHVSINLFTDWLLQIYSDHSGASSLFVLSLEKRHQMRKWYCASPILKMHSRLQLS